MNSEFNVMTLIISEHQANHFIDIIKEMSLYDGIVFLAKGTVKNSFLNLIGLKNQKMRLIDVLIESENSKEIMDYTAEKLKLNEPNHGIAYLTSRRMVKDEKGESNASNTIGEKTMFK